MSRSYCSEPHTNYKLFVAVTNKSDETRTRSSTIENLAPIKLAESDDFHDSMMDVSEQPDGPQLSRNVGTFGGNSPGSYFYKN